MATEAGLNPFLLAASPTPDPRLLESLRANPSLASAQDSHGYSLLHAASSYNHVSLLRALVNEFKVDVNMLDEDGETCLFVAESAEVAKCLVEELGADEAIRSREDGLTARQRIENEGDWPQVAAYLRQHEASSEKLQTNGAPQKTGPTSSDADGIVTSHPPPLPPNMTIDINTTTESTMNGETPEEPDPEFRRRIEELAASEDFHTEAGQQALRELIVDAVRGVGGQRDVRRKMD